MSLFLFFDSFPNDSGPIYQETLAGRFPVEPFNTYSNLLFLGIIIYFSIKVYRNMETHKFLAWSMPFLLLSYIGGTVYHATRSHDFWMYLDWLPIVVMCFAVSVYFTARIKTSWKGRLWLILIVLFLVVGIRLIPWARSIKTSVGYIGTALGLLLPIFVYMYTKHMKNWILILFAIVCFGAAITFRVLDRFIYILPMGTHWLWHSFGAFAVFFLISYIYRDRLLK
ncbi:hypothetical protein C7S20_04980 [Christiangramia fulva]|uniref:Hemolysin III n=1 Tax=Christiangramia fulva TaxID=2126553 RepID=A0A2R3Z329_9FLAO|nr:hypothetical protein [Christiangramia fulva]AVR44667.1 hypothetical protein C7S20_04980 [Christiangramia fulva]